MTLTALFAPIQPRLDQLERKLDAIDRGRRALAALRSTPAPFPAPAQQENT